VFDVGFWEVSLIGVLALIIIGPERLPGVARTAGKWLGKARRMMTDIKSDIKTELDDAELSELKSIGADLRGAGESFKSQLEAGEKKLQSEGSAMDTAIAGALNKADDKPVKDADTALLTEKTKKKKSTKKKASESTATEKKPAKKKTSKKKVAKKKASKKKVASKVTKKPASKTTSKSTQSA